MEGRHVGLHLEDSSGAVAGHRRPGQWREQAHEQGRRQVLLGTCDCDRATAYNCGRVRDRNRDRQRRGCG